MPDASTGRMKLKFILFTTAVILVILAAARPQFGSKLREQKSEGIEMMLAVDISNSMLAEDFEPNRLERTKYAINKLFDGLEQDRVGVIVFAGDATVQLPITSDYRMAKAFAKRISPSMASVQGTSIGKALSLAEMSFSSGSGDSRVIILITDGEDHEGNVMQAAERAAEQGIRIFTIGIGTPEGAPIEIGGEFIKDEKGDMVVSKLDEKMLQEIAGSPAGPTSAPPSSRSGWTRSYARSTTWSSRNCRPSVSKSTTNSSSTSSRSPSRCCSSNSGCSTAAIRCWRVSTSSASNAQTPTTTIPITDEKALSASLAPADLRPARRLRGMGNGRPSRDRRSSPTPPHPEGQSGHRTIHRRHAARRIRRFHGRSGRRPALQGTFRGWHASIADAECNSPAEVREKYRKGRDGVTGAETLTAALKNYRELDDSVVLTYIKCIVHMVADFHCPAHVRYTDATTKGSST